MSYLFLEYAQCGTCRKAKRWLDEHKISYEDRPIVEQNPTESELKSWLATSRLPLKSFFNTSGLVYKSLQLKDKLPVMSQSEQIKLLASDGKLIKRPIIVGADFVLVGFKPEEWENHFLLE